jgi:hypothetical protein
MIKVSEVIEACALEADKWATPEQIRHGNGGPGAAIRALSAKYDGCIVAEGEAVGVYTGKDYEYGYDIINMHDEVPTKTLFYRAKETK